MTCRRSRRRFARTTASSLTTHENPDGDALGSLLALQLALRGARQGHRHGATSPAPLPGGVRVHGPLRAAARSGPRTSRSACSSPSTAPTRSRIADPEVLGRVPLVVDIDHHHDNSRFGQINLIVADASSTGEVLRDVFRELDVELTPEHRRGALHRARHRHRPLPVHEHDAEVAPARGRARRGGRRRPPRLPGRLRVGAVREAEAARARARAGADLRGRPDRRLVPAARRTSREVGAEEPYSEGIIDYLRAVDGAELAVLIREPPRSAGPTRRVSLRASIDELDVSADRARRRRRRPPAGGRLLERGLGRRDHRVHPQRVPGAARRCRRAHLSRPG